MILSQGVASGFWNIVGTAFAILVPNLVITKRQQNTGLSSKRISKKK